MTALQVAALVAFLCAAVLAAVSGRVASGSWPLALLALGLALWLLSTTKVLHT
jgi:hypothetical protein